MFSLWWMAMKGTVPHVLLLFIVITIIALWKGLEGISVTLMQERLYFTRSSSSSALCTCACTILPKCLQVAWVCSSVLITKTLKTFYLPKQNGINIRFSWYHILVAGEERRNVFLWYVSFYPKITWELRDQYLLCKSMWCSGPRQSCSRENTLVRMKESRGWRQINWPACKEVICCWKNSS